MSVIDEIPEVQDEYNQTFYGFIGEFGSGANSKIFYLQSAIKPSDLDKITLISDMPGAETWSVRDLFQRDVDSERVTSSIIPYFKDKGKVKFFNPLTLTILPINEATRELLSVMQDVTVCDQEIDGKKWSVFEAKGLFRYRYLPDRPQYGRVEWNDRKIRIVAIDGQHRLSALKRYAKDPEINEQKKDFLAWSIPVVLFGLRTIDKSRHQSTILDIVRNIFIYINTQARTPSPARQILLTDESVNAVCTQELLEYSHENDVKDNQRREQSRVPLLFYDWRGEERGGREIVSIASLKSIVEIRDWLSVYVLGEDFSSEQKSALGIQPVDQLHDAFAEEHLGVIATHELRKVFAGNVLPGIVYLLENYTPLKEYVSALREIESMYNQKSDIARHAFHQLRFGTHSGGDSIDKEIRQIYGEILEDISDAKWDLPEPIRMDIGLRGVVYAFGAMRKYFAAGINGAADWKEYSKWYTLSLNQAYDAGWLKTKKGIQHSMLLHVTHDHNDSTINYRLDHSSDALGAFMCLLTGSYGLKKFASEDVFRQLWEDQSEKLYGTLLRGYKKQMRVFLKDQYPNGGKELNDAVKVAATEKVEMHIEEVREYMEKIYGA